MRFDCGETWQEKKARLEQWHAWFAWYPTRVGSHDCRWMERIDRKGTYWCSVFADGWIWEHRKLQND